MYFRRKVRLAWLSAALLLASGSAALAQQTTPPRRPSGPAAGPIIKLPRDGNASLDQTQNSPAKEQAERAAAEPRRWEYCAIVSFNYRQRNFPSNAYLPSAVVRFFPNTFEEVDGMNEEDALANAFARLGDDGWELTGVGTNLSLTDGSGKTQSVYYFKRPKRAQE